MTRLRSVLTGRPSRPSHVRNPTTKEDPIHTPKPLKLLAATALAVAALGSPAAQATTDLPPGPTAHAADYLPGPSARAGEFLPGPSAHAAIMLI